MTDSVNDLWVAAVLIRVCILGPDYHFPDELALTIALSETGEQCLSQIKETFPAISDSDANAALLGRFASGDALLVNPDTSAADRIISILSREIAQRSINYPFVFGRELHDQFIENFGTTPVEVLTSEQTQRLVQLTPQGVFQLREWVTGPFGLLRSDCRRPLRPQTCGPAIRCQNTGCNTLHHIQTRTSETDAGNAYSRLSRICRPLAPEMTEKLANILNPDSEYYLTNHPGGLPWLIGNGFTYHELSKIVEGLLATNTSGFRERVNSIIGGSAPKKPSASIVKALSHAALIQLLLLLDNIQLVKILEGAIEAGIVSLSPTEVRRSFENRHLNGGYYQVDAEAARLGVRFVPKKTDLTEPRIVALIKTVFSNGHEKELSWQLRNERGSDSLEKLERGAEEQDPRQLVRRLLFSSQEALERAFNVLEYGNFSTPETEEAEEELIEKILWKLGSPLPAPVAPQTSLEKHAGSLSAAIISEYNDVDARMNSIRSTGMSMFVALEELLQKSAEFACWALLADHYDMHPLDRFRYSRNRTSDYSCKIFENASGERGTAFPYDTSGKNGLSVQINSFRVLAEVCESRLSNEQEYARPEWQIPDFSRYN